MVPISQVTYEHQAGAGDSKESIEHIRVLHMDS